MQAFKTRILQFSARYIHSFNKVDIQSLAEMQRFNQGAYTPRLLRPVMWYPITQLLHWYLHWSNHAALVR